MKNLFFISTLAFLTLGLYAQRNAVFMELGGNGLFGSINYERQLTKTPKLYARLGIGFWTDLGILGSSDTGYTVPISFHYLLNLKKDDGLDFGIGATIVESKFPSNLANSNIVYIFTSIGYRRNFWNNFFCRVHVTPYVTNVTEDYFTISSEDGVIMSVTEFDGFDTNQWFGASLGVRF
ncbi:MAG: hypothetical protein ED556_11550 [Winogradskyella sp.]|uniref:hypothetical protein n=1 Tax=Winogradskyella sp. TaxID=1883156 RepID=UPI000F3D3ABC|nr:hypothetical protein [Winogradskyella sp.]RNC84090.1 MAG: hypothetical protein ED556_11550 [Winogradskyella sp.]